ncbi:CesT family type III secretion system chaperone [Aquibium microcysteis]|uniref:CesT family type III secretion system chaperone n=1 Tax=Aquibium microcysteis TaxID=675281 RepID=UPI00165CFB53
MNDRVRAERLVAELGAAMGLGELTLDAATDSTVLVFDGELIVNLEYDAAAGRLVFSSYLGELPAAGAEAALRELMAANLFWHRTRGATLCLEEGTGGIILLYAHPVADLDARRIEAVLENVVNQAERWGGRLAAMAAEGAAPDASVPLADADTITIRL